MNKGKELDKMPRVVLSHAGMQHSYQLALALQELETLEKFFSTLCYHDRSVLAKTLKFFFPKKASHLKRRKFSKINIESLKIIPWPEMLRRGISFIAGRSYFTNPTLQYFQNRVFDYYVSTRLGSVPFDVFIGLSGASIFSLRRAKDLNKITVIDQHDIHYELATRLLAAEIEIDPKSKTTITYWPPYQPYLDMVQSEMEIADFIMVPSTFSLKSHLEAGIPKEKLILLPHTFEPRYELPFLERPSRHSIQILFIGSISHRKGIIYLMEAVKQLKMPDVKVILIGDNCGSTDFLAPYKDNFISVGYVPYEQLKNYFSEADIFVLPTIYDAFGLSALEAMAAGLPVIVSENCAAGSDIVRDGIDGYVIPIRDVEVLKKRLMALCKDKTLREEMGRNARIRAREFGWSSYVGKLSDFLSSI